jgi:hypothetical protein
VSCWALSCRARSCWLVLWLAMREQGRASARLSKSRAAPKKVTRGRGVAQLGSALRSGRRGRRFKSGHPDPGHRPPPTMGRGLFLCHNRVGCAARSRARVGCGPFPRSLPPNPVGTFQCAGLSSDCAAFATELRPLPAVVAEDFQYRPGILHYAYLTVPLTSVTCAPSPCGPALPVSRIGRALLLRLLRALCRHRTRVP